MTHDRVDNAENFLRKMLADNTIGFSHDIQWREWAVNFYLGTARYHLQTFEKGMKAGLGDLSTTGSGTAKSRWDELHSAFETAVNVLEDVLRAAPENAQPKAVAKKPLKKKR